MLPTLLIISSLLVILIGLLLLAAMYLVLMTYGWALPFFILANAVALGWGIASGNVAPGIVVLAITVFAFYGHFRREQRRLRILSHCIAALFAEATGGGRCTPEQLLASVHEQITQDYWVDPLDKFARRDALLFYEPYLSNGSFAAWYAGLHRIVATDWFRIKSEAAARNSVAS